MKTGDIVTAAGGNYTAMAVTGGVVAIHIKVKLAYLVVAIHIKVKLAYFVVAIHIKISNISLSGIAYDN